MAVSAQLWNLGREKRRKKIKKKNFLKATGVSQLGHMGILKLKFLLLFGVKDVLNVSTHDTGGDEAGSVLAELKGDPAPLWLPLLAEPCRNGTPRGANARRISHGITKFGKDSEDHQPRLSPRPRVTTDPCPRVPPPCQEHSQGWGLPHCPGAGGGQEETPHQPGWGDQELGPDVPVNPPGAVFHHLGPPGAPEAAVPPPQRQLQPPQLHLQVSALHSSGLVLGSRNVIPKDDSSRLSFLKLCFGSL